LDAQPAEVRATSSDYAGDIRFGISDQIVAKDKSIPYTLNAGLTSVTPTRLGFRGLLDLRDVQAMAPELLSGTVATTCALTVVSNLDETGASGDLIALVGTLDVELYRCRDKEVEGIEGRGGRLLKTTLGVAAAARANVRGQCVHFDLADVALQPTGFIGGLVNLFGLTERVETVIVDKAAEFAEENPICPKMPPELSSLAPALKTGGTREISEGGIGVTLSGSGDTSAETLMQLLSLMQSRGLVGGAE